ncbi:hypothetical protein JOF56_004946 [Kibdelosporangium banguiense]|uniref:DUF58 domain-containing protein n=1 Tax=Kibdelosporangium banguiense TaxID=1365924 RepID=A0ABS4TJL2_9PSEU|nr:hypothetical protein [Kibdelosporangium banguiense]MBP2324561.1 hypothetical protein [Kibdelosporangium banguiense]
MKALAWIALAVSLVCTGLYVTDSTWENGWMFGPILLVSVVPILFSIANKLDGGLAALRGTVPRAFRDAPIGIGTVVSVSRTGLTVNDQPQLEIELNVDTPNGLTFRATTRQIVDLMELGAVHPGAVLPVRYLPDGQVTLAIDASRDELQTAFDRVQLSKGLITPKQLHITEHGVDAQAVILAMAPTGEIRGDRAVVNLTLRITRPNHTMFDLIQQKALPPSAIAQTQPGSAVRVRYLPQDESEVTILTALTPS